MEGGVEHRVASLEKVIAATKKKRKAEEAEMEDIDGKLEFIDGKNREIKAGGRKLSVKDDINDIMILSLNKEEQALKDEKKELKRRKVELKQRKSEVKGGKAEVKDRRAYLEKQEVGNRKSFENLTEKKQELEVERDVTVEELKQQEAELRRVLGEGMARAGGASTTNFLRDSINRKAKDLECPVRLAKLMLT